MKNKGRIILLVFLALFLQNWKAVPDVKIFHIDGKDVKVTHKVDGKFYGRYSGHQGGFLLLNTDGTGEYLNDYFGYAQASCKPGPISLSWGFLVDENNNIVRFKRDYGYSYPVVYLSSGEISFQGCRKKYLVDYLMVRPDGTIGVSSSDDWEKNH
jgi:hypothetical protein